MITIINGIPGAGKTLFAVSRCREEYKDRTVYYHRIPQVDIPEWRELPDPLLWHTLPEGSVIIVDEAHEVYPKRDHRAAVPEHIEAAATLRHRGHDLVLITQFPGDLDIFLRRRAGRHIYLKSPLTKANYATAFVWPEYQENFRDEREQEKSDSFIFKYPTDAFQLYKSSSLHTKKKYVPKALIRNLGILVGGLAVAVFAFNFFYNRFGPSEEMAPLVAGQHFTAPDSYPALGALRSRTDPDYYRPAVPGIPWSAPFYAEAVKPETYPRLVCVASRTRCSCYTQQATRLPDVPDEVCRKAATDGVFNFGKGDNV